MLNLVLLSLAAPFAQTPADLAQSSWLNDDSLQIVDPGPQSNGLPGAPFVDGRVLVRFGAGVETAADRALVLGERFRVTRTLVEKLDLHLVEIVDGTKVEDAVEALSERAGVVYATPDHVVSLRDTFPNDSNFNQQFGKHNTGQTGGTFDADMDAPEAWDYGTGSSDFVVGIVDSGTQLGHPDLVGNRWENSAEVGGANNVDDDGNGYVDDLYGWDAYNDDGSIPASNHGTHVAGIAAAQGDNGIGITGVSWNSRWVAIGGSSGITSTVMLAYGYALDLKDDYLTPGGPEGANIVAVNSSFGIDFADCTSGTYAPWNDMYDLMGQSGILSVAATMNNSNNVDVTGDVPTGCTSDYLISVTALDDRNRRNFTAFGATSIDLGAAGEGVYSTLNGSSYGTLSGTSMATPQVTGAIAYLHSVAGSGFSSLRDSDPAAAALLLKQTILDNVDMVAQIQNDTVSGGRLNIKSAADAIVGPGPAIQNFCGPAVVNSTGNPAVIEAAGSIQASQNMFRLRAVDLPPGQGVLFLAASAQATPMNVANSIGRLCLGNQIGRLVDQLQLASGAGEVDALIDLANLPQPSTTVSVLSGETWYFQAWYRDRLLGTPISNFTDGLRVTFE